MSRKFGFPMLVAAALVALAVLSVLPATLTAETEPRDAEVVSAKGPGLPVEETTEPSPKADRKTKKSALDKLALKKLTIERPAPEEPAPVEPAPQKSAPGEPVPEKPPSREPPPEKPAPAPEPAPDHDRGSDQGSDKKPRRLVRAGVTSTPVLPGPAKKAPAEPPSTTAPPAATPGSGDNRLLLSIPRLGLESVPVGDSRKQSYLDREGILHLSGTGFPHERGSNTYIAGHAADFDASRIPNVFRNLHALRQGDLITLRDATGRTYNYRAHDYLIVNPRDVWVTKPLAGKQIVSLQTCFPSPTFEKRLVVRGELVQ